MAAAKLDLKQRLVVLRLNRLGHTPPALYAVELLAAKRPVLVVEYGLAEASSLRLGGPYARLRLGLLPARMLPQKLRAAAIWTAALVRLAWLFLRRGRPRLMITCGLSEQAMALVLHRLFGVPFTAHVYEVTEPPTSGGLNSLFFRAEGAALRQALWTVYPEAGRLQLYRDRYQLQRPAYLVYNCARRRPPAADRERLRRHLGVPAGAKLLLYIGGLGRVNALEEAIEAVAARPDLHFIVAGFDEPTGERYAETLAEAARRLGCAGRVRLVGVVDDKWPLLEGADVCYCVYRPESLRTMLQATASNKAMEAVACGLPILALRRPDFTALVEGRHLGVLADSVEPAALAAALARLLDDPAEAVAIRASALAAHAADLNFEAQFAPLLAAYERLDG